METFTYYIVYLLMVQGHVGHGCCELKAEKPIETFEDVRKTALAIESDRPDIAGVTILDWKRLQ